MRRFRSRSREKPLLVVENARLALARCSKRCGRQRPHGPFRASDRGRRRRRATSARTSTSAPHAYVGRRTASVRGSVIGPGAYVGDDASIGESAWLHPHASVMDRCVIGNRVVLHAGSVIGSEGFGWAFVEGRLERIPQVGNVVLDDDVEIGANTCVDRAQTGSTHHRHRHENRQPRANRAQLPHRQALRAWRRSPDLAGSTVVGDYVKIAGQVGTRGHMTIGSRVDRRRSIRRVGRRRRRRDDFGESGARTPRRAAARGHDSQAAKARCSCRRFGARNRTPNDRSDVMMQATLRGADALRGRRASHGRTRYRRRRACRTRQRHRLSVALAARSRATVRVPAVAEYVVDTSRATVLGRDGAIGFDHRAFALRACSPCGVSNARDRASTGPEIPVCDGSARNVRRGDRARGRWSAGLPRAPSVARRSRSCCARRPFGRRTSRAGVSRAIRRRFRAAGRHAVFRRGDRRATLRARDRGARARSATCTKSKRCARAGWRGAASLDNALVFAPDGPMQPLRWPNEVVRHKVLDLIGDFALLGAWPQCEIVAIKSGHELHARATRALRAASSQGRLRGNLRHPANHGGSCRTAIRCC